MASNQFNIASYNLHGLNSGISLLLELCTKFHIIAVQEHWQSPQNLYKLNKNKLHKDFNCFSASGMNKSLESEILRGRPFGGVGLPWHKSLSSCITFIGKDISGRYIAARLILGSFIVCIIRVLLALITIKWN